MSAYPSQDCSCSQNFLKSPRLVAGLLNASSINPGDLVVEIGPGRGIITEQLALACRQVLAVEKDPRLVSHLRQKFSRCANVNLYEGDFLRFQLPGGPYKVFANLPFNITSAVIGRLVAARRPPEDAFLVMQKEATDMYLGLPHESMRTILIKPWFELELLHRFRRTDFTPTPRVEAAMLRLRRRAKPLVAPAAQSAFRDFVVYSFTAWRPNLQAILKELFSWRQIKRLREELRIELEAAPSGLSLEDWLGLFARFEREAGPRAWLKVSGSEQRLAGRQLHLEKVHRTRSASR